MTDVPSAEYKVFGFLSLGDEEYLSFLSKNVSASCWIFEPGEWKKSVNKHSEVMYGCKGEG